ncbi:hypothetical protein RND81_08G220700 [Saponaria officinalis]|uniref:indole-3-glycerol-phosphate synthase n=1 Tax=Saponaria officinalis TaxID=3572 RepID=A0AAW1JBC4_SAPOF
MEGIVSIAQQSSISRVSLPFVKPFDFRVQSFGCVSMDDRKFNSSIRVQAQQSNSTHASATIPVSGESLERALKIKEWEAGMLQAEVAASQGIKIRRRPPTAPPSNYDGPFEFRAQDVSNAPSDVLEEIIWFKDVEVSQFKERLSLDALKEAVVDLPPTRDFPGALRAAYQRTGLPGLIAEVKKASPTRGILRKDFNPVEVAKAYERGGAACLSVLTDEKYFQGSFENLEAIRSAGVQCPLLCKEFVVDAWQIYYARLKGADAVLLIAGVLTDQDIRYMLNICKTLGLAALVEVHDEREMDRMLAIEGIELIGINNRDLGSFEVDISNTRKLLDKRRLELLVSKNIIVVGESGLFTPTDINYVLESGVKAVLVGESLVKQPDPAKGIANLFGKDISLKA